MPKTEQIYHCLKCKAEICPDGIEKFFDADTRLWAFKCPSCGEKYDEDSSFVGQLMPIQGG